MHIALSKESNGISASQQFKIVTNAKTWTEFIQVCCLVNKISRKNFCRRGCLECQTLVKAVGKVSNANEFKAELTSSF